MLSSRATLFRWLRVAAAGGIVVWLAARAGVEAIARQFHEIDLALLAAALALLFADSLAKAWNWRKLIASLVTDREVPFAKVMSWYFAGGFLGAVVPSSASTDVLRAYLSQRALGGHGPACAASVLTLNGLGWFAGCLLGLVGIALLALGRELPVLLGPAAFVVHRHGGPSAGRLSRAGAEPQSHPGRLRDLRWQKLKEVLRRFVDAVCVFERAHVRFLQFLVISMTGMLAQAGMFALTAAAVGVHLPFAVWMILAPLTRLDRAGAGLGDGFRFDPGRARVAARPVRRAGRTGLRRFRRCSRCRARSSTRRPAASPSSTATGPISGCSRPAVEGLDGPGEHDHRHAAALHDDVVELTQVELRAKRLLRLERAGG